MTLPEHLTITGPEDILGFIPHSLGYWPADSLVALTMQGKRLGATLRIDLPAAGSPSELRQFSRSVGAYLEADAAADGTLLAFFTNEARILEGHPTGHGLNGAVANDGWFADDCRFADVEAGGRQNGFPLPSRLAKLLVALETELCSAGMPVRDAWVIGDVSWRSAYCSDPDCCPPAGHPVDEIRNSRLNAEMVFRGSSVGADPADAAAQTAPRPCPDVPVLECEGRWTRDLLPRRRSRGQFEDVLNIWTRVLSSEAVSPLPSELAGYLRASLLVPPWRDAVLVMAAAGRLAAERGAEEFGIFDDDECLPVLTPRLDWPQPGTTDHGCGGADSPGSGPAGAVPGYGDVLLGLAPAVPRWEGLRRLEQVLVELGWSGGGEASAAALTGRGWIEWCRGRGSFADALLGQAARVQPGYRLAELLAEMVRRGMLCGWAGRKESAWQRFEPDAA